MKIIQEVSTGQVKISFGDDRILLYVYHTPDTVETLENAKNNLEVYFKFVEGLGGGGYDSIIDLTNLKSVEIGVKEMYKSDKVMACSRLNAIVAQSLVAKVIGNFFLKMNRPANPTKIFSSQGEARDWILHARTKL